MLHTSAPKRKWHLSLVAVFSFLLLLVFLFARPDAPRSPPAVSEDPNRLDPQTTFVYPAAAQEPSSIDHFNQIASTIQSKSRELAVPLPPTVARSAVETADSTAVIEFSIMSRCPDVPICMKEFAPAVKRLHEMKGTSVVVNYIADGDRGRPKCMHGDEECVDNIYQLCAHRLYSEDDKSLSWFDFLICTSETKNAQACADKYHLDFHSLRACAFTASGTQSLVRSVLHTRAMGVRHSCTVSVDGEPFCAHNGVWQGCGRGHTAQALVDFVCQRHPTSCVEEVIGAQQT